MKANDLISIWGAPDNSRLTKKQISLRLPVHVAARISALCEMYPNKTKTEIITDLLAASLDQLQTSFPKIKGQQLDHINDPNGPYDIFDDIGPSDRFNRLANKHYIKIENELGNTEATAIFSEGSTIEEYK